MSSCHQRPQQQVEHPVSRRRSNHNNRFGWRNLFITAESLKAVHMRAYRLCAYAQIIKFQEISSTYFEYDLLYYHLASFLIANILAKLLQNRL